MTDDRIVLNNAAVLDVAAGELLPDRRVILESGRIKTVEPMPTDAPPDGSSAGIDLDGKTVMPGLCDAHVHVTAWTAHLSELTRSSPAYTAARTAGILNDMLMRGFTTVRDGGGADYGLAMAVEEGYIQGPRILFCGRALSQTGGHADLRKRGEQVVMGVSPTTDLGYICDGTPQVRRACREEIRKGASHVKLMLSGGVCSPTDRVGNSQFSEEEIRAAVEEAEMAGLYCMGHVYTARATNRALECGVRSLEHCNLIDESSVELFLKQDAFMVPTLATYEAMAKDHDQLGLPEGLVRKLDEVKDRGTEALQLAHASGVRLAYGTDLLGEMHRYQLTEFALRAQVQAPIDIIRSATVDAAELVNETGETGIVAEGARADLLVVDGNPLSDLACLQDPERYLSAIIKNGILVKNAFQGL